MNKNPIPSRVDPEFHDWIKEEAKNRKTSMLKLQKRIARNAKTRMIDVLDNGDNFFK